jgi:serine/threonine protein phosphatase PrpC
VTGEVGVLRAYGVSDKGRVRATNEDYFAIDERLQLVVVADGMGGHNAGEVASHVAVDAIVGFVRNAMSPSFDTWPFGFDPSLSESANVLKTAVLLANSRVLERAGTTEEYAGMGTTVVAALVDGDRLSVAHVGDSRLYIGQNGKLRPLTRDDSWMATILATNPETDPAMLQHHPMRHALTNVVGSRAAADVHIIEEPLSGGEVLLLTTDGVHGVLDVRALERIVERVNLEQLAAEVVKAALARGSRDNCTAVAALYTNERAPS